MAVPVEIGRIFVKTCLEIVAGRALTCSFTERTRSMSGVDVADGEPAVLHACGAIGNANTGSKSVIAKLCEQLAGEETTYRAAQEAPGQAKRLPKKC